MEPENNIAVICESWISSGNVQPLLVVSNDGNHFGKKLKTKYQGERVWFTGPIYDPVKINNLRYFSSHYFHGHSVGGTNPSLLEAMACSCNIIAHDNPFNRAILGSDGHYFSNKNELVDLLKSGFTVNEENKKNNLEKIRTLYNWEKIVDSYEQVMRTAGHQTA
jgi:glycosyltransferase involved in cell wall biosynthesis